MPLRRFTRVADLREGLILRHLPSGDAYIMVGWAHHPRAAVVVRHITLSNPIEWFRLTAVGAQFVRRMGELTVGDVVRHRGLTGNEYVVVGQTEDPEALSGIAHRLVSDPTEWAIYDSEPDDFPPAPDEE